MLIDCSFFTSEPRYIYNATMGNDRLPITPSPDTIKVNKAIMGYVCAYQEEFLSEMVGYPIANKLHTYIICKDEDENHHMKESFESVLERLKESFADYIFFKIIGESNSQATITGLVHLKSSNNYASPMMRQVQTWNRMVKRNRQISLWFESEDCPVKGLKVSENLLTTINSFGI